jgi:hypothetical protein
MKDTYEIQKDCFTYKRMDIYNRSHVHCIRHVV